MFPSSLNNAFTPESATAAQRSKIIEWGIPNYKGEVGVTALPFTAPIDCVVYVFYYSYEQNVQFFVNDVLMYQNNENVSSADGHFNNNIYIPMKKGDVLSRVKGSGTTSFSLKYFPYTGK